MRGSKKGDDNRLIFERLLHGKDRAAALIRGNGRGIVTTTLKTVVAAAVFLCLSVPAYAEQPAATAPPSATAASEVPQAEDMEENLVLQLVIGSDMMEDFIDGLKKDGKTYLPVGSLSKLLDLAISVDAAKKTADGWFINEDNRFSLNEKEANVRGSITALAQDDLIIQDGDIYANTALLQKWLPLDFTVDTQSMTLHINAREKLPYQEALWRKKAHDKLKQQEQAQKQKKTGLAKLFSQDYEAFQWPSVDLTMSPSYTSVGRETTANYSLLAAGDFGYLTSNLYASGDLQEEALSDLRLTMGREDYERNLLGFMHASSFSVGDITAASLEQVISSGTGRGVTVTNRALDRPDKFDVTSFIGDGKPGWDVELYRNDTLVSFQTLGTDGRYQFIDIPVVFGNNVFRLVFYGPQGQREEITKTINADSNLLEKGEFSYNLSADEKSKTLFGVADTPGNTANRLVGEVEYGVTRWLTAVAGGAQTDVNGTTRKYATAGLHATMAGFLTALDTAYDTTNSGHSTRLSVSTNRFGTDINIKQKIAKDFTSESDTTNVTRQTDLNLSRELSLPFLGGFGNTLQLTRKTFENGNIQNIASHRLSKQLPFFGMSVSNTLEYDRDRLSPATIDDTITLHGSYNKIQLDAQADYAVRPERKLQSTKLAALFPINDKISDRVSLSTNYDATTVTELENTITFDMEKYKLSLTARANTEHEYYAGVVVNTSIGKLPGTDNWITSSQPIASTGTVAVRPFIDANYNQKFDPGEEILSSVPVRIGSKTPTVNDKGLLIATQMPVSLPVTVSMDKDQQSDPFRINQKADPNLIATAYNVVPRAGKVIMMDFPLFETSQLEGTVRVPEGESAGKLQVELITSEGQAVGTARTAFDGYYLMESIMPGTYTLRVSGADGLKQADERSLTVDKSDIYTLDVTMERAEEAPTVPQQ